MYCPASYDWVWKLLTFIVAGVAAYIAFNQYRVAKEKLRLELFEKRHAVYRGVRDFIGAIVREGRVPNEAQIEFWKATADADFLFGPEVVAYINEVNKRAARHHLHHVSIDAAHGDERSKHIDAESELTLWFADQFKADLRERFAPYLAFAEWRA